MLDSTVRSPAELDATSSQLLNNARLQDADAWRELFTVYAPVLRYWIKRSGVQMQADVNDIVQNVLMAVTGALGEFERQPGKAKFRAWLKAITQSKVNNHYRQLGRQPVITGGSETDFRLEEVIATQASSSSESAAVDDVSEETLLVRGALNLIRPEFRPAAWQAFWRTAVDGCAAPKVADELQQSSANVRQAKSRVLRRLREVLEEPKLR